MTDPAIVGEEPTRKWREDKVRPLPGTLRTTGSVKPGTGIVKESLRRSLLATLTLVPIERTILGAQYAFWKAWRNLSGPMGFQKSKPNPGPGPSRLPSVGPEPRQKNASGGPRSFSSSADEFRPGYSLIGVLASIARLRFTGTGRITCVSQKTRAKGDISTLP